MARSPQELRDEADKTESGATEKAEKLREAADQTEKAEEAQKEANEE